MAFKPNYRHERAERTRAKEARQQEKLLRREEASARRKALRESEAGAGAESSTPAADKSADGE